MLLDGIGHLARLAVVQRVIASHDALQLGKLADHSGEQIGFREPGGSLGEHDIAL